jgi:seryl-tRNA synthetase
MLDLRLIRHEPDAVRAALARRGRPGETGAAVDALLALDEERRALIADGDTGKARRNEVSRQVAQRRRQGEPAGDLIEEMRSVNERIRAADARLDAVRSGIDDILLRLPNLPDPSLPDGGEEASAVVRSWGEPRTLPFTPRPHWELGAALGILDLPGGARVAGSGFPVYRGMGARLQRSLINFMLDVHTREHGYLEVEPPFVVHRDAMQGTGQYPKFVEDGDAYHLAEDGLYLIPTAEVPVTNLHRDEILDAGSLPIAYTAYSPCFRREAGAAGKDTRGLLRVHQFDKVELVRLERPEESAAALEAITAHAERILQLLELPYRVLLLAAGDTGFASAMTYDLEVWAPGVDRWLEVSSASNCRDFQARRASIRFRPQPGARPELAHTLNASGVALPRTVIALLENGQQEDGSVVLPPALHAYVGAERIVAS